jgi:predicted enzyme related to lactoylglutathione lyase
MILGLRTAIYPVTDLSAGKKFYSAVLGVEPYFDQPFYVGYSVGGFELGLIPDGQPGTSGSISYWGVADANAALKRLLELGAKPHEDVLDVGDGILVGKVLDPFGNIFAVIQNPHFDAKKVR